LRESLEYCDYNFCLGAGVNTPKAFAPANAQLMKAGEKTGRDIGAYVLFMVILLVRPEGLFGRRSS